MPDVPGEAHAVTYPHWLIHLLADVGAFAVGYYGTDLFLQWLRR